MDININNGFGNMSVGQLGGGEAPQQLNSPKTAQQTKDLTITEQSKAAISKYLKTKFEDDYDRIMRQYAVYTELRGLRAQHAHPLQPEYIKVFFID